MRATSETRVPAAGLPRARAAGSACSPPRSGGRRRSGPRRRARRRTSRSRSGCRRPRSSPRRARYRRGRRGSRAPSRAGRAAPAGGRSRAPATPGIRRAPGRGGPPAGLARAALVERQPALAALGQPRVVGDQEERHPALGLGAEHQVGDGAPGRGVEVAGRLVGEQEARPVHQRPRQGHALLLAARELGRVVAQAGARGPPPRARRRPRPRPAARPSARPAAPRSPARSASGSGGRTGTGCRPGRGGTAPARPRRASRGRRRRPRRGRSSRARSRRRWRAGSTCRSPRGPPR